MSGNISSGKLFYYYMDPYRKVPIFLSGTGKRTLLWIGGQCETFLTIQYFPELIQKLGGSWNFTQIEIPSSHIGFGGPDHLTEAADIVEVIKLLNEKYEQEEVALFATNTGLQLALEVLKSPMVESIVTRFIVHGVVTPLDNPLFSLIGVQKRADRVTELMKAGRRDDASSMADVYDLPITPARLSEGGYPSLQEALWQPALEGRVEVVQDAFGHINVPSLIMCAKNINYRISDEEFEVVKGAAEKAMPNVTIEFFADTCDEVRRLLNADIPHHVTSISDFLLEWDRKRQEEKEKEAKLAEEEEKRKRNEANKKRYSTVA